MGLHHHPGRERRASEVTDFPALDQRPRAERVSSMSVPGLGRGSLEIYVIGAQPAQAGLALGNYPSARIALPVAALAHLAVELRGQDHVLAPLLTDRAKEIAHDFFRLTGGINVGSINEIDARVEGTLNYAVALFVVGVPPSAEHHGAQAQGTDLDSGATESAVFHGANLPPPGGLTLAPSTGPIIRPRRWPARRRCARPTAPDDASRTPSSSTLKPPRRPGAGTFLGLGEVLRPTSWGTTGKTFVVEVLFVKRARCAAGCEQHGASSDWPSACGPRVLEERSVHHTGHLHLRNPGVFWVLRLTNHRATG